MTRAERVGHWIGEALAVAVVGVLIGTSLGIALRFIAALVGA